MKKLLAIFMISTIILSGAFAQRKTTTTTPAPAPAATNVTITVAVTPANAIIYIDGAQIKGNVAAIKTGTHTIMTKANGYADFTASVNVSANMTYPITMVVSTVSTNPAPLPPGPAPAPAQVFFQLAITANPANATIFVDGVQVSGNMASVTPGNHSVKVSAQGYTDFTNTVSVAANMSLPVTLQAIAPPGPSLDALRALLKALENPKNLVSGASKTMSDVATSEAKVESSDQSVNALGVPITTKVVTQKFKASASFDTQVLLNPSTDVIYPGSVILGSSIDDGSYKEITSGTKKDVTISFDLSGVQKKSGGDGVLSGAIKPTLSRYRELRNQIMSQSIPKQTSTYSYEMTEINSEEEMNVKIGAGVTYTGGVYEASVKAGFNYDKTNTKKKTMIRFMQTFYTVDIDQDEGTFLFSDFDVKSFKGYRPVYVSSVAYGRLAYLTVESDSDMSAIKANLDAMFKAIGTVEVNASVETATKFFKEQTKTNITVIGGSTVAVDLDSFIKMLQDDTFSESNSGKIVAYKLRFVDDNSIANIVFNGEYTVRNTDTQVGKGVDVSLKLVGINSQVGDSGSTAEFYGDVVYSYGSQSQNLWSYAEGRTCDVNESGYTGWDGPVMTFNFPNVNGSFTVSVPNLREDDSSGDDQFNPATLPLQVSNLKTGTPFTIRSVWKKGGGEWVEFTIMPTITYKY